jgi:uncharacterized protein (TIGR02284 family)
MITFVGTQTDFMDAMNSLIELEYDATEAYQAALDRLHSAEYRNQLSEFLEDHQEHIAELSAVVEKHGGVPPSEPSMGKQWLAKGKVVIANLMGDKVILLAMADNEKDTNKAYERMSERVDVWQDAKDIIKNGLEDEKRHKAWLDAATA